MKSLRAAPASLLLPLLAALWGPVRLPAQSASAGEALAWVNRFRAERGLSPLRGDPVLERCARLYALQLAASGALAHRDARGDTALQRYRRAGGSAARVGEALGAGPGLGEVQAAWASSPTHAALLLGPQWTHGGAGSAARGGTEVWVLLLAEQPVEELRLERSAEPGGGYVLAGRFRAEEAAEPVLLSGFQPLAAGSWQPEERRFLFLIPDEAGFLYHRLGYRTADGRWVLTNAFFPQAATSFPETGPR